MLTSKSLINVKDNSGIITVQCIQVIKAKKSKKPCTVGDFIKATVKKGSAHIGTRVKPGQNKGSGSGSVATTTKKECLRNLTIIQTRKKIRRLDGSAIRFNLNSGVTVNERKQPLFKRVTAVVPFELKKSCSELLNLAKNVI